MGYTSYSHEDGSYYSKKHKNDCCKHDNNHENDKKHDKNEWIRKEISCFKDMRLVFFVKGNTHVEGTVSEVHKDFIVLVPTRNTTTPENVEVESNSDGSTLEQFLKYFLRLDDIVGFGEDREFPEA